MTDLLASLPVPIIVAVVTALLTSELSSRRAAADRVAELRMRSYTDALVTAHECLTMTQRIGSGSLPEPDEIDAAFEKLRERLQVLSIVASPEADGQLEQSYAAVNDAIDGIEGEDHEELRAAVRGASGSLADLVVKLTEVARKDVRRTRA